MSGLLSALTDAFPSRVDDSDRLDALLKWLVDEHLDVYRAAVVHFEAIADARTPNCAAELDDELDREEAAAQVLAAIAEDPGE